MDKTTIKALYDCKQPNGKYRKEIENTGVFISDIWEMQNYIAQQPNGQWQAFDYEPILTERCWERQGDQPDNLKVEGDLGIPWNKTLCRHERYQPKLIRMRKTLRVRFP